MQLHCYFRSLSCTSGITRKWIITMQITAIIVLAASLQVAAHTKGQTVTLKVRNAPLKQVLISIQEQTGFSILFDNSLVEQARPITIDVKDMPLNEVMNICLKDQPFQYTLDNNSIIVKSKQTEDLRNLSSQKSPPVTGTIRGPDGQPLAGVNVMIKGTKKGTVTDKDGKFSIDAGEGSVLEISSIGYGKKEISISSSKELIIALDVASSVLDKVQIIAYGQTTKRLSTGNVVSVSGEDIQKQPGTNALLALPGRVPGLYIVQSTGLPGSGVTVRIQGQNSIVNGSDPLFVVDGVPYFSQIPSVINGILGSSNGLNQGSAGSPLSFINPADIESIEVLKDADATSIYGSRAANGAILITTKKGKAGKTKVELNLQHGFGKVADMLPLLNTQQYLQMRHEAKQNDNEIINPSDYDINGTWDTSRYTDWQKVLIGNSVKFTNAQASVSGGNANTQFIISTGYSRQTTVFPGSLADQKGSLHFNINNVSANQKFRIQLSGTYQIDDNKLINQNLVYDAMGIPPHAPELYNSDGSLNWAPSGSGASTWTNPLSYLLQKYNNKTTNLISNALISYTILPGLELKSSFGLNKFESDEISTTPLSSIAPEQRPTSVNYSIFGNNAINTWIIEPQAVYKRKIGNGTLEALIGTTIQQSNTEGEQLFTSGYSSELVIEDMRSASTVIVMSTLSTKYKYNALSGRLNYNWQDKYLINLVARRDGSSRFGPENQFHNFASVGTAWIFSNERLFDNPSSVLSFGKIRASYGTTGNDQIGDYTFLSLYNPVDGQPYQGIVGLKPGNLINPYLQWEETKKLQVGLDLGFFNDRILFNGNYFRNRSSNQLMGFLLPVITGFGSISRNFPATVQNSGWELILNTINVNTRNIKWSSSFNITVSKNTLVSFDDLSTSPYSNSLVIGQPITILRAYHYAGLNPNTGLYEVVANDGHLTSNPSFRSDAKSLINTSPVFFGGFLNNVQYKGFELDILFQFIKQKGQTSFYGLMPGSYFGGSNGGNQPASILQRWQKPGDQSPIQKFSSTYSGEVGTAYDAIKGSDAMYPDASYIRLKNVSLSWELPEKFQRNLHMNDGKLFILGQNLLTFTSKEFYGLDPESATTAPAFTIPPLRVLTFGLKLTF